MSMLTITLAVLSVPTTHVECETSVAVGDGRIVFELWPHSAPVGAQRFEELVQSGFMNGLPMFRAIPNFLIQFGIQPDHELHMKWEAAGNIQDDPPSEIPFTDGILSYAGYGKDSRGTHLFMTLGNQPGLGKSPWEVPVGKVVKGLDVMHAVYTGYGDQVQQGSLRGPGGKQYLSKFPRLDSFRKCVVQSATPGHGDAIEYEVDHQQEVEL